MIIKHKKTGIYLVFVLASFLGCVAGIAYFVEVDIDRKEKEMAMPLTILKPNDDSTNEGKDEPNLLSELSKLDSDQVAKKIQEKSIPNLIPFLTDTNFVEYWPWLLAVICGQYDSIEAFESVKRFLKEDNLSYALDPKLRNDLLEAKLSVPSRLGFIKSAQTVDYLLFIVTEKGANETWANWNLRNITTRMPHEIRIPTALRAGALIGLVNTEDERAIAFVTREYDRIKLDLTENPEYKFESGTFSENMLTNNLSELKYWYGLVDARSLVDAFESTGGADAFFSLYPTQEDIFYALAPYIEEYSLQDREEEK